ncbi:MAG TPA: cellulase family glycosylhydrolase [Capsulimonadaceae bacterium]|jgi:mannan endo-1,4-beta-mannosidase
MKRSLCKTLIASIALLVLCATSSRVIADPIKGYHVTRGIIVRDGVPMALRGVNAFHVYAGDGSDLDIWPGISIVREYVRNLRDTPLDANVTVDDKPNHARLHSLTDVVANNTARGRVTILCPFGWDGTKDTLFRGKQPSTTPYYADYKARLHDWAVKFASNPNVWLEVWNEPFAGPTTPENEALWLADMTAMVDNLRTAGWDGIIVVPTTSWGQDEGVIFRKGGDLTKDRKDVVFDVHVYEQWLKGTADMMGVRLDAVKATGQAFIIGEVGPQNNLDVLDTAPFLNAARSRQIPVLGWVFSRSNKEANALLTRDGKPHDTGNFNWGSTFRDYLAAPK